MKCPHCSLIVTDAVPVCEGCGFSIKDVDAMLGEPPEQKGFVTDLAGRLAPEEKATLEKRLSSFQKAHGGEMVLVIVSHTEPVKPAEYVFWLFNHWEVGGASHSGLMLLLAIRERRIESEVGYSWEPVISDLESGVVLDEYVVPLLHEGQVFPALQTAVDKLIAIIEKAAADRLENE